MVVWRRVGGRRNTSGTSIITMPAEQGAVFFLEELNLWNSYQSDPASLIRSAYSKKGLVGWQSANCSLLFWPPPFFPRIDDDDDDAGIVCNNKWCVFAYSRSAFKIVLCTFGRDRRYSLSLSFMNTYLKLFDIALSFLQAITFSSHPSNHDVFTTDRKKIQHTHNNVNGFSFLLLHLFQARQTRDRSFPTVYVCLCESIRILQKW